MKKKLKHTHSILVRFITANNSEEKDNDEEKTFYSSTGIFKIVEETQK